MSGSATSTSSIKQEKSNKIDSYSHEYPLFFLKKKQNQKQQTIQFTKLEMHAEPQEVGDRIGSWEAHFTTNNTNIDLNFF